MKRRELLRLADERIEDARTLIDGKRWPAAYYLAGYAVECALKAGILAKLTRERVGNEIIFDRRSKERYMQHDIDDLSRLAGLKDKIDDEVRSKSAIARNWAIVKNWNVETRYNRQVTRKQTQDFYLAVTDPQSGIIPWIKNSF